MKAKYTKRDLTNFLKRNDIQVNLIYSFRDSSGFENLVLLDSRLDERKKIERLDRAKQEAEELVGEIEQLKKQRKS
jgi:hypothetical protein